MQKIILFAALVFLYGCVTTPVYHGPKGEEPFARVNFEPIEGLDKFVGGLAVEPQTINDSSVSFQRMTDSIFVQPGMTDFVVKGISPDRKSRADCEITFEVKGGETYLFKRKMDEEDFIFIVENAKGEVVFEQTAPGTTNN